MKSSRVKSDYILQKSVALLIGLTLKHDLDLLEYGRQDSLTRRIFFFLISPITSSLYPI